MMSADNDNGPGPTEAEMKDAIKASEKKVEPHITKASNDPRTEIEEVIKATKLELIESFNDALGKMREDILREIRNGQSE